MIFVNKTSEAKTVICNAGRDKDIVDTPPLEILVVSLDVRGVKSHKLENTRKTFYYTIRRIFIIPYLLS